MDMLEVRDLSVKVEDQLIIKNVSLSLKEATSHILFGPNGSGKTTLISALMGLPGYEIVSGQILFRGEDITQKGTDERARLGIVVSFQNPPEVTGVKLGDLLKLCLGKKVTDEFSEEEMKKIEAFKLTSFLETRHQRGFQRRRKKAFRNSAVAFHEA